MSIRDMMWGRLKVLAAKGTEEYRKKLNKKVHVLDFGYEALRNSAPTLTYLEYLELLKRVKPYYPFTETLENALALARTTTTTSVWVKDKKYGTYIVGNSYGILQSNLSAILHDISKKYTSDFTQVSEAGLVQAQIAHISSSDLDQATTSPLEEKIMAIFKRIPFDAAPTFIGNLMELQAAHTVEATYQFQRPDFDIEGFKGILGTFSIVVTLQTAQKNNELSQLERYIDTNVKEYVNSDEFKNILLNEKGSNSILEDVEQKLVYALQGKKFVSKHAKKPNVKQSIKLNLKVPISKVPASVVPKPIRNVQGQFYSLASLQMLINTHLQDVVSANMGDGSRRDILNYRTGRFAASVKVERLTQSREGMISAFYSYMKYPYQVFEPGHPMGSPKTRDPKLLIAKSIAEIAATKVGNRLRAVLI